MRIHSNLYTAIITAYAPVVQLDRMLASEAKDHRFESCRVHHPSIDEDVDNLVKNGAKVVIPKTKGVLVTYVYIQYKSGNYIEIAQE